MSSSYWDILNQPENQTTDAPPPDPEPDPVDPAIEQEALDSLEAVAALDNPDVSTGGQPSPIAPTGDTDTGLGGVPSGKSGIDPSRWAGLALSPEDIAAEAAARAHRAAVEARAQESVARARAAAAQATARFNDWVSKLPLAEKDKQELRDRHEQQDAMAQRRMQLAEDAAARAQGADSRAQESADRSRIDFGLKITRESMRQPAPLKAPPAAPANAGQLTWDDVSAFLEPNEEAGLTDAWQNGNVGVGMIAPTRLRYLMANFPIASDGSALLTKMRSLWRRTGGATQRAPATPRQPAISQPLRTPRLVQPRGRGGTGVRTADLIGPQDITMQ